MRGETQRVKVKVSKIAGLANDLALALAASSVRIEAPVPGTSYVGVEVPNHESNVVGLKELMESEAFQGMKGKLGFALGEDVKGQPIVSDRRACLTCSSQAPPAPANRSASTPLSPASCSPTFLTRCACS